MATNIYKVGSEFLVNSQAASLQDDPSIAGLADGGFVVSWTDTSGTLGDESGSSIKAQVYDAGGGRVGTEFLVNSETADSQDNSTITGLANGGFVVSWITHAPDVFIFDVKAQIFNADGTKVGTEFLVSSQSIGSYYPAITRLDTGGFVASWSQHKGDLTYTIKAQVFDANGSKVGAELQVSSQTDGTQSYPTLTALTTGGFVMSWHDNSGTLGDASGLSIKAQIYDANAVKVGNEFLVNTWTADKQHDPAISGLADGGFVVSWINSEHTFSSRDATIEGQRFDSSGAKVGNEFVVSSPNGIYIDSNSISSLTTGGFVVSWSDVSVPAHDAGYSDVKAQIFDAEGAKVGAEFLVNSQIAQNQVDPTITDLENGNIVVSWTSFDDEQDGSVSAIKAQIFSLDMPSASSPSITSDRGGSRAEISIAENGHAVTTVTASDVDGDVITYAIAGGTDAALFSIDKTTGALAFLAAPDFEAPADANSDNVYDVIVSASDSTTSDTQALVVTVTNLIEGNAITGTQANDAINTKRAPVGQPKATALDDLIFGNGGNDNIDGGAGADTMHGGIGNDTFTVDNAEDKVIELADEGIDTMKSGVVDLTLAANVEKGTLLDVQGVGADLAITGNDLANTLTGNRGANTLAGGEGKDVLNGKGGNDTLSGGTQADQFKFDKFVLADGLLATDTITDFSGVGGDGDRINLSAIDANGTLSGNQKFAFIGTGEFSGAAGQLRYEQSGDGYLVQADLDGDHSVDFAILVYSPTAFAAADFIL